VISMAGQPVQAGQRMILMVSIFFTSFRNIDTP
jgi:hypothetical protein